MAVTKERGLRNMFKGRGRRGRCEEGNVRGRCMNKNWEPFYYGPKEYLNVRLYMHSALPLTVPLRTLAEVRYYPL